MADPADLRGFIRDSNVHAEIVDAVVECYRDNALDYTGAMNVLLGDSNINREQNIQHTRREKIGERTGRMLTLEEQHADWEEMEKGILERNPDARIHSSPAPRPKPVARKPARTGTRTASSRGKPRQCMCGCGGMTKGGRFVAGHDAKLKSIAKKVLGPPMGVPEENAEFTEEQWNWLATQGYEPPEGVI